MKEFKARCSKLGNLMTSGRSKSEHWGVTAIAYLDEWYIGEKYNRYKDFSSKYTEKGIEAEEDSITLLSAVNKTMFVKNEENLANDFITGTPDIIIGDVVRDVKTSWSIHTFFAVKRDGIPKSYAYQLQGYLWLTGATTAFLDYCLVDTPDSLIEAELRKLQWSGVDPESSDFAKLEEQIRREMTFGDIPKSDRVQSYEIKRDEIVIESIKKRVIDARELIKQLY